MSDDRMDDELDRRLRDALQAEAEGVEADDALLGRITEARATGSVTRQFGGWLAAAAAILILAGTVAVVVRDRDADTRLDVIDEPLPAGACVTDRPVFDPRWELIVYPWPDASVGDVTNIGARLSLDPRIAEYEYLTQDQVAQRYQDYGSRYTVDFTGEGISQLHLVDLRDDAELAAVAAAIKADPDVRGVQTQCVGGPSDDLPPMTECPPYDLLFLLTPVVTPEELAAFEERFSTDPRVESFEYVPVEATGGEEGGQYRVQLASDPGTGEPPPDDTEVRNDIGQLHGTSFVLERQRCRVATPADFAPMPTVVAVVLRDGRLVRADLTTGEVTTLASMGDPDERDPETGMRSFIDDVEISPDGRWAYFSHCCEPASGQYYRVSMTDPDPRATEQALGTGRSPRVRPDGSLIATNAGSIFLLHPADPSAPLVTIAPGAVEPYVEGDTDVDGYLLDLVWSPDGSDLAALVSNGSGEGERWHIERFRVADRTVERVGQPIPVELGDTPWWTHDGKLEARAWEYGPPRLDPSRQWQLTQEEGGSAIFATGPDGRKQMLGIPLDEEIWAIDW